MNLSALAITFIACVLLSTTDGLLIRLRCRCTNMERKEIPDRRIVKIESFLPGPQCRNREIIATVKLRKEFQVCLNPNDKWVQNVLKKRNLAL